MPRAAGEPLGSLAARPSRIWGFQHLGLLPASYSHRTATTAVCKHDLATRSERPPVGWAARGSLSWCLELLEALGLSGELGWSVPWGPKYPIRWARLHGARQWVCRLSCADTLPWGVSLARH